MISRNQIYTYIEDQVNTAARPVYCDSVLEPVPESFPACYIVEMSHYPSRRNIDLSFEDVQLVRDFEVHTYSNRINGALTEALNVMTDVETAMREMGFIETYCGQTSNIDPTVVHVVARFTRIIADLDTI